MDPLQLALIALFASLAGWINAIAGVAGGVLLFAGLNLYFSPVEAIALHGVAGFFSNALRVVIYRRNINWSIALPYLCFVIPGGYLGIQLVDDFPQRGLKMAIGLFIIAFALMPTTTKPVPPSRWFLYPLGFVSSFLSMIVGIVGPFIAPFFLRSGLVKADFIGTKSLCQGCVQLLKVILCLQVLSFDFTPHLTPLFLLMAGITAGTFLGKRSLKHVSNKRFKILVKTLLALLGLHILVNSGSSF